MILVVVVVVVVVAGWLSGWLAGWLADWLAGWQASLEILFAGPPKFVHSIFRLRVPKHAICKSQLHEEVRMPPVRSSGWLLAGWLSG